MRYLIELGLFVIVMMGAFYVFRKFFLNDKPKTKKEENENGI
jgi:hypothetical protein